MSHGFFVMFFSRERGAYRTFTNVMFIVFISGLY